MRSARLEIWLQREPLGYIDGLNLYQYVRSNPVYWGDPSGNEAQKQKKKQRTGGERWRRHAGLFTGEFGGDMMGPVKAEMTGNAMRSDNQGDQIDAVATVAETFAQSLSDAFSVDLPIKAMEGSLGECCEGGKVKKIMHTGVRIIIGASIGASVKYPVFEFDFGESEKCPTPGNYFDSQLGFSAKAGIGKVKFQGGPRVTPDGTEGSLTAGGSIPGWGAKADLNPLGTAKESIGLFSQFGASIGADIGRIKMFKLWLEDTDECCDE